MSSLSIALAIPKSISLSAPLTNKKFYKRYIDECEVRCKILGGGISKETEKQSYSSPYRRLQVTVDDALFVNRVHGSKHLLPSKSNEIHIQR